MSDFCADSNNENATERPTSSEIVGVRLGKVDLHVPGGRDFRPSDPFQHRAGGIRLGGISILQGATGHTIGSFNVNIVHSGGSPRMTSFGFNSRPQAERRESIILTSDDPSVVIEESMAIDARVTLEPFQAADGLCHSMPKARVELYSTNGAIKAKVVSPNPISFTLPT